MLWRVRTTVVDRPGALAGLAVACGEAGVNILGLQIFPGLAGVTDELVIRVPKGWDRDDVIDLLVSAGTEPDLVTACSPHSLVDQTIRHLRTLRSVLEAPDTLSAAVADLLDASLDPLEGGDEIEVPVGREVVTLRRAAPFAHTEYARISAFAELASELLDEVPPQAKSAPPMPTGQEVGIRLGSPMDADRLSRMVDRCSMDTVYLRFDSPLSGLHPRMARRLLSRHSIVAAAADGEIVGLATLLPDAGQAMEVSLIVEDRWQRRAIGRRLLVAAAAGAKAMGANDLLIRTRPEHPSVMGLVGAAGLRGRVLATAEHVEVLISLKDVTPAPDPVTA
jgi:GNAT superfamily N-acetyltransferase